MNTMVTLTQKNCDPKWSRSHWGSIQLVLSECMGKRVCRVRAGPPILACADAENGSCARDGPGSTSRAHHPG
ncbi:hypothetical protein GCM10009845_28450 [Pedococcus bigeumensis]